ncbi:MAG TPA: hypothetical protein PKM25_17990 [Candidatus Ozemobacteraceae bacterium]|nr:hypothetical protein [Candidatus Ozemobacteraceae bacterium]
MKIETMMVHRSWATDMKQSQAITSSSQNADRAKTEALQASPEMRGKLQDAYVKATQEGSNMEQSLYQKHNEATKRASAQAYAVTSDNTHDVTSVISSLIAPPINGKQAFSLGRFLDRFA